MASAAIEEFPEGSDFDLLSHRPSRPDDKMVARITNSHPRVWVISAFQPDSASRHVAALLGHRFSQYLFRNFGFLRVELFARPTGVTG
ncbi:MAG: hypothetical protein JOZ80_10890 [Acidobacteriaceae bacterium]|nr:hypothetical protein [Acidobacteriaceae bacterium]